MKYKMRQYIDQLGNIGENDINLIKYLTLVLSIYAIKEYKDQYLTKYKI